MTMEKKIKIGLVILIVGVVVISGWFIWHRNYKKPILMYQDVIPSINSADEIEKFVGIKVNAIGFLNCSRSKAPCKIRFYDGTTLALSVDISEYNDQLVEITGLVYQCKFPDQCHGIVLTEIMEIRTLDSKKYVNDPSYCKRGIDCIVWLKESCPEACDPNKMASCCRYSINFLSKPINPNDRIDKAHLGACRENRCEVGK